ncbi:hypothetical protein ACBZ91_05255 [Vibrio natriegens]|uniref:hypothetical protein n=1 Tax=Vibrio natriegens TaxID=691 RepID=UPI003557DF69
MINFEKRLGRLKVRRQGALELGTLEKMAMYESVGLDSLSLDDRKKENYETLRHSDAIKYTIGAMSPVDEKSTQVSIDEGERVANTLIDMLETSGIKTSFRMQGSVPLNVHIKGHSDVDMLILIKGTFLYENPRAPGVFYFPASDKRPMEDILRELRENSEEKLTTRYFATEVDCSNAKSIAMSGGSLKRKIDIVPSCWYNNIEYQLTDDDSERQVKIYNKDEHILLGNSPFKHIKLVDEKDQMYNGNLKKCVRLVKNLVADMPDDKKKKAKKLTSFDIVGVVYNMNEKLNVNSYTPLALVDAVRQQFNVLRLFHSALNIKVPDGSREVLDSEEKISALEVIYDEIRALSEALYKDIVPLGGAYKSEPLKEKIIIV